MSASKLEKPAIEYKESHINAMKEFHAEKRFLFMKTDYLERDFQDYINKLNKGQKELFTPYPHWVEPVPETTLWFVKEHNFIGALTIRHRLNWHLEKWGGHIGCIIRPSMRGKGFGKKLLQKAMPYIAYHGVENALITITPENKASKHITLFCGGKLEDTHPATDRFPEREHYWLNCT